MHTIAISGGSDTRSPMADAMASCEWNTGLSFQEYFGIQLLGLSLLLLLLIMCINTKWKQFSPSFTRSQGSNSNQQDYMIKHCICWAIYGFPGVIFCFFK